MKRDVHFQAKTAAQNQENYEREVVAHSASLQALAELKTTNSELKTAKEDALAAAHTASHTLKQREASFEAVQKKLEGDIQELEIRYFRD